MGFFFNDTATTEIYTLSLHDALPIWSLVGLAVVDTKSGLGSSAFSLTTTYWFQGRILPIFGGSASGSATSLSGSTVVPRSEEHTSELQSRQYLVCRLLLEKKKKIHVI